jgi:hypothetical protein
VRFRRKDRTTFKKEAVTYHLTQVNEATRESDLATADTLYEVEVEINVDHSAFAEYDANLALKRVLGLLPPQTHVNGDQTCVEGD